MQPVAVLALASSEAPLEVAESERAEVHRDQSRIEALGSHMPAGLAAALEKGKPLGCSASWEMDGKGYYWKRIDASCGRHNDAVQRHNVASVVEWEMARDEEPANEACRHDLAEDGGEAGAGGGRWD